MPRSFPPIRNITTDGTTKYQATCRTCGRDVCSTPQAAKAAVEEMRRAHGFEADCTGPQPLRPHPRMVDPSGGTRPASRP